MHLYQNNDSKMSLKLLCEGEPLYLRSKMKEKIILSLLPSPVEFLKDCFVKTNPAYFAKICYRIGPR